MCTNLLLACHLLLLFFALTASPVLATENKDNKPAENHCVVLLHGLTRSSASMEKMATALENANYQVINVEYPSTEFDIATLANFAITPALSQCKKEANIHFVTHSLGGILLRQYLSLHTISNLSYSVMLGPPNKGSEVVDKLGHFPPFFWLNGPAGLQLGTDALSPPNTLGKANFEVGIIAGNRSINWILSALIPGPDDGKVSVQNTKLVGMKDFIVLPVSHPFMMKDVSAIESTLYFLQHGKFTDQQQ